MPTPQTSANSASTGASNDAAGVGAAEDRTFPTEAAEALAGDGPAELLMDDINPRSGQGDGTAKPQADNAPKSGAASSSSPLKAAAGDLANAMNDVLKGKAGSARQMAKDAYDQLKGKTAEPLAKADGFVRQKPYAALGVAVIAGMLLAGLRRRR
jgi:ElaB/YqjD/DUF883 family membrane-anchored ribosome-binding protein